MIRQCIAHFFHALTLLSHIICILKEQQYSYIKKRQSTQPCLFFTHLRKWLYVYRTPSYKRPERHFLNIRYHINPFISSFTHAQMKLTKKYRQMAGCGIFSFIQLSNSRSLRTLQLLFFFLTLNCSGNIITSYRGRR